MIDDDGNVRGRGTADLKGGLSVQLYTMKLLKQLKDSGCIPQGNLIFSAVVHEEAAEMFGMEYLLKKTLAGKNLNIDFVLLCEPTGLEVALGQRAKLSLLSRPKDEPRIHQGLRLASTLLKKWFQFWIIYLIT